MSAFAFKDKDRIPCTMCGTPTRMLGTKLCDGCWECQRGINAANAVAVIRIACEAAGVSGTKAEAILIAAIELAKNAPPAPPHFNNDADWKERGVKACKTPTQILELILQNISYFGDNYYRDLADAMLEQADIVLAAQKIQGDAL